MLTVGAAGEQAAPQASKAQKRRQAREQEEAERERRIAEEQAQAGDSERVLEERSLAQLLQPLGLAVRDIPVSSLTFPAHPPPKPSALKVAKRIQRPDSSQQVSAYTLHIRKGSVPHSL